MNETERLQFSHKLLFAELLSLVLTSVRPAVELLRRLHNEDFFNKIYGWPIDWSFH